MLDLERPDALGYMPMPNGKLQLVAVFFLRPALLVEEPDVYEPPPIFLGHPMYLNTSGAFAVWEMKVWVWAHNPDGLFAFYNPRFQDHCDYFVAE